MSVGTGLYDGDLLHGLDTSKVRGSLCVFYGLSLSSFYRPSYRRLAKKGLRSVSVSMSSTYVASYHYC